VTKLVKEINDQDVKKAVEYRRQDKSWDDIKDLLKIEGSGSSFVMKIRPLVKKFDPALLGGGKRAPGEPRPKRIKERRPEPKPKSDLKDISRQEAIWIKAQTVGKAKSTAIKAARGPSYKFDDPVVLRVHQNLIRRNPQLIAVVVGEKKDIGKKSKGRRRKQHG